jgi:carotenoid phi-ring synthase / carotenoid chi-ring synthase
VEGAKRIVAGSPGLPPPTSDCLSTLGTSPVIVIRLWFDPAIETARIESCITPGFAFIDNFFDVNEFDDTIAREGHVLEVQSYRVDDYLDAADETILDAALRDIAVIHPSLRGVRPLHWTINRHVALFTRYAPNEHGRRPGSESGVPGFYFAGDWTKSEWSVWMMERGIVSGLRAANSVLRRRGGPELPILRLPKEHWLLRTTRAIARGLVALFGLRKRVTRAH